MEANGHKQDVQLSGIKDRMCLSVAKLFLPTGPLRQFGFRKSEITRFDSMDNWISDRTEQIEEYRKLFEPFADFEGKTVLELGCNRGYLLDSFLKHHDFKAIGADIDDELLALGREELGDKIDFIRSTPATIPLPDASVDVIYSIDTFEHLSNPNEILMECHRVLRPGGVFFLHFSAWYTPYGSHLEDIIPLPWANTFFSMDTLLNVAAHLYESPDYEVACYYLDPVTGKRRSNPFLDKAKWDEYLNKISIRKSRKILKALPFEIVHLENIGFGGKVFKIGAFLGGLSKLPVTEELFTKATFVVMKKPQ